MKLFIPILMFCSLTVTLFSQEKTILFDHLQMDFGYIYMRNRLNSDHYFSYINRNRGLSNANTSMSGGNLKFTLPTKIKYLDLVFGTTFLVGNDDIGSSFWYPGYTNSTDYLLNGGGVYAGVSPKLKGKRIGLTSEIIIGVFAFKEYIIMFNNRYEPYVDIHEKRTSNGIGGMSSLGFYFKKGKIGINPSFNLIFSNGDKAGFVFYGFVIPITYQIKLQDE